MHQSKRSITYICFKCFVTHCAVEWAVNGVDFEMFPDVGDPLEELAALSTLIVSSLGVDTEVFGQRVLGDEALVTVWTLVGSVT